MLFYFLGFFVYLLFLIRLFHLFNKQKELTIWDLLVPTFWLLPLAFYGFFNFFSSESAWWFFWPSLVLPWLALFLSIRLFWLFFTKKLLAGWDIALATLFFLIILFLGLWILLIVLTLRFG
ncbi:MAG: hypothetical protein MRECE_1c144 [Mycoplasmataceae bacterium CE_OT135]|nr:MAG: hypothetical protein MRECE_1c023 [Mycoplasmataceae bacterium CE_OT135]KLL04364.1 MAG: hypothetical protein MRECE_1c144 [Mycoplasmataceae bacterium CE_OT135]